VNTPRGTDENELEGGRREASRQYPRTALLARDSDRN
jgi:hypothetical protein